MPVVRAITSPRVISMFTVRELNRELYRDVKSGRDDYWIEDYKPEHMRLAEVRFLDKMLMDSFDEDFVSNRYTPGYSFTAFYKGQVVMIYGISPLWKGVADLYMVPTVHLNKHKFVFHKAALRFFEYTARRMQLHRYQCYVCCRNVAAVKWIEACYFHFEGKLYKFGPDLEDYSMYGRLF